MSQLRIQAGQEGLSMPPGEREVFVDEYQPDDYALTIRDLVLEMRRDMRRLVSFMDVMQSQVLEPRVSAIEAWRNRVDGRVTGLLVAVPIIAGIVGILVVVKIG